MQGRIDIFKYYLTKMAHDDSMVPAVLATETPGYTPADIKYLLNESLRYALFSGRAYITYDDFRIAQPEHHMGMRAPIKHMSPEAKRRLAYYQAGHAVAIRLFMPHHRIARITIIRQGQLYGHVSHYPAQDTYQGMWSKVQMESNLKVLVAGKAAEIEFLGAPQQTVMVERHLTSVKNILNAMAMAGILGPLGGTVGRIQQTMLGPQISLEASREMREAMEAEFQKQLKECRQALRDNAHIVNRLAELLLEKSEINANEVRAFFDEYGLHTPDPVLLQDDQDVQMLEAAAATSD
jgi:cell division protease FtsH